MAANPKPMYGRDASKPHTYRRSYGFLRDALRAMHTSLKYPIRDK